MIEPGTGERINPGSEVIGSDDQKLGSVAYVVVRPPEMEVTDIVVSTGALLGRDVVVPIDKVAGARDGKVYLTIDKATLGKLPDYVDIHYKEPPAGWVPPAGFYYPAGSMLWPANIYYPEETSVTVNAPPDTVGLSEGMEVESSDGHKVGTIDGLDINPTTEDVDALIIKHGFPFSHDTLVPVEYVSGIHGGVVRLNLTKDEVQHRLEGKPENKA